MPVQLKRAYEPATDGDGYRVLVERLWPRGVTKEAAKIDLWLKDAAPSTVLRKWYAHDVDKWDEFRVRYFAELDERREVIDPVTSRLQAGETVTFIFGSKEETFNSANALWEYIEKQL